MSHFAKNIVIGLLLVLVLGQACFFWSTRNAPKKIQTANASQQTQPGTPEHEPLRVVDTIVDGIWRLGARVEFNQPLPESLRDLKTPASIQPALAGQWKWSTPYTLQFLAESPLDQDSTYEITLDQAFAENGFLPEERILIQTGQFRVKRIALKASNSAKREHSQIEGTIFFNAPVDPKDLAKALSLREANGTEQSINLLTHWTSRTFSFKTDPIPSDQQPRTLTLCVSKELTSSRGSAPLKKDVIRTQDIRFGPDLYLRQADTEFIGDKSVLTFTFSAPISPAVFQKHLRIDPAVEINCFQQGTTLRVTGNFQPGKNYSFLLTPGLSAEDGTTLPQKVSQTLRIPSIPPFVDFKAQGMFLPKNSRTSLALEYCNTKSLELTVNRVFPNNLIPLFQEYGYSVFNGDEDYSYIPYHLGSEVLRKDYTLEAPKNIRKTTALALQDILPKNLPGLYKISINSPESETGATRWVMRTDIGLLLKKEHAGYQVWASSIDSLRALKGITINLLSSKNQVLGTGITDANGLARIAYANTEHDDERGYPFMLVANAKDDTSFLLLDRFGVDTTGLDIQGASVSSAGLQAYTYAKRDIYRPGETLEGAILVRTADLNTPETLPLRVEQRDPQGQLLRTMNLSLQKGVAPLKLDIPDWALTGTYNLSIQSGQQDIGSYSYQVEEFIPDRIKVEINAPKTPVTPGQSLNFAVQSHYLFGPPAAHLNAFTKVHLKSAPFLPKGYETYTFGDAERNFEPVSLLTEETQLNAQGQAEFAVQLPDSLTPPLALQAEITSRVQEQGGRGVTARRLVPVHVYPLYPGLKKLSSVEITPGKASSFEYVVVSPKGAELAHNGLEATLYKDHWQTVVRKTDNGFQYTSVRNPQTVAVQKIAPGQGQGSVSFTPPTYGSYRLQIKDPGTGASSVLEFYSGGWGYSPWAVKNPARLELIPDKPSYKSGETASIQIRAPFGGKAFITVEGQDIEYTNILSMPENTAQISIPIQKSWQPNRHLTVTLVRKGADILPGTPGRAFGAIPLFVDSLSNKMPLEVLTPQEIRPDTELEVCVQTLPEATVSIALVDEGILQLAGGKNPDPFEAFYAKRALSVQTYDNFSLLFPHITHIKPLAGGGLALSTTDFIRTEGIRRVKPVTFWSGMLQADSNGQVRYAVHVPEFTGALRVVAVGHKNKAFGTGTGTTRVRSPLVLTPTLPRFLSFGDQVDIPITVRNDTPKAGTFTLAAHVTGPATLGDLPAPFELAAGTEKTVYLPLSCGEKEGRVEFHCTVSGNSETSTATVELDQRSPLPINRILHSGVLKSPEGQLAPDVSAQFIPETVTRKLRASSTPLLRFGAHLEQLLHYPYGCAEQTTSKAFPLLYFTSLAAEIAPKKFSETNPEALIQAAIRRLQTMQTPEGGYGWWPGATEADPWVSAYVCHFLLEAQKAGYSPAQHMTLNCLEYLKNLAVSDAGSSRAGLERRAYALYILALGGQTDLGSQDYLRTTYAKKLSPLAKVLLAGAYLQSDSPEPGYALLGEDFDFDQDPRETGGNLNSPLRNKALTALILQASIPDDPHLPKLMTRIGNALAEGSWYSTQETSLAFMALGKYMHEASKNAAPFRGALLQNQQETPFASTRLLVDDTLTGAQAVSLRKIPAENPVYFTVLTSGNPRKAAYQPLQKGLCVEQHLFSRDGQPLDGKQVQQGDLLVLQTNLKAENRDSIQNTVVQTLLPAGLEVENPRLSSTEKLDWMHKDDQIPQLQGHQDLRDDRILLFTTARKHWQTSYTLLRAVSPGSFTLPPVQAEAMYDPDLRGSSALGSLTIQKKSSSQ